MGAVIRFRNVSRHFGPVAALQEFSLEACRGELLAIVGPDGSGKTTLARLAAGVLTPTAGQVELPSSGQVGYVPSRFSLYPDLTVRENLAFLGSLFGMSRRQLEDATKHLLGWAGLSALADRLAGALSGGMRRKLALACALIHRPGFLVLDEPTTGVDPLARADFWRLLREQCEAGGTVLVTTPYLDELEVCDRVGLLHHGRLLALGPPTNLVARLPYQMAHLTAAGESRRHRAEWLATANRLPGLVWTQPKGRGIRVALESGVALDSPSGYSLTPVPPVLEDAYLWLSGYAAEVMTP